MVMQFAYTELYSSAQIIREKFYMLKSQDGL